MRIIDLFNKKVNNEKLPKKIKYQGQIFEQKYENQYETDGVALVDFINFNLSNLDDEIKIIEDEIDIQDIKELKGYSEDGVGLYDKNSIHFNRLKINELVQAINKINKIIKQLDKNIKEK